MIQRGSGMHFPFNLRCSLPNLVYVELGFPQHSVSRRFFETDVQTRSVRKYGDDMNCVLNCVVNRSAFVFQGKVRAPFSGHTVETAVC